MAPRSQCNSRAGSRMHSLSNSVHNSPALGPEEKDILGVVPVVLTPAAANALLTEHERAWTPSPERGRLFFPNTPGVGEGEMRIPDTVFETLNRANGGDSEDSNSKEEETVMGEEEMSPWSQTLPPAATLTREAPAFKVTGRRLYTSMADVMADADLDM